MGDLLKDLAQELSIYIGVALGMRAGDKTALRKEIYLPTITHYLPIFEQQIANSASGFLTETLTWVDFFLEEYLTTLHNVENKVFKKYPYLAQFVDRILNLPQLTDYVSTRPNSVV